MLSLSRLFIGTGLVGLACASSSGGTSDALVGGAGGRVEPGPAAGDGAFSVGGRATPPPSKSESTPGGIGGSWGEDELPFEGGAVGVIPAGGAGNEEQLLDADGPCLIAVRPEGPLVLKFKSNSDQKDALIQGEAHVANVGGESVPLERLELRYFFASEYDRERTLGLLVRIDHAEKSGRVYTNVPRSSVHGSVALVEPELPGASAFVSIEFLPETGTLLSGETILVKFRLEPPESADFSVRQDQTNDYSFGACARFAAPWPRAVLLEAGVLLSGEPPEGLVLFPSAEGGAGGTGASGSAGAAGAELGAAGAGGASGSFP